MKTKIILPILVITLFVSCKPDPQPEHTIEWRGKYYKEPVEVTYDLDGDGVSDGTVGVLGTNLDVTSAPDGKELYTAEVNTTNPEANDYSLVPTGEKLCYLDVQKYCDEYGGLYAYETTVNGSQEAMVEKSKTQSIDENNNGVIDYIETLRETGIDELVQKYSTDAAQQTDLLIEEKSSVSVSAYVIENAIESVIKSTLLAVLNDNDDYVDVEGLEQDLSVAISQAIIKVAKESNVNDISAGEIQAIAYEVSSDLAQKVTSDLSLTVTEALLDQYAETQAANPSTENSPFQGICPNGYHIPSDTEWMIFEKALGMSDADLVKSGETVTDRGASAGVVKKMVEEHSFDFGGYVSVNGTFAQMGEAGVYWSSTLGTDAKGTYVWVRQIDTSYTGVVRYKHYKKSGLSIRCFKN